VFFRDKIVEVATFRAAAPSNGEESGELLIRDDNVFGGPEDDAVRRDFTFNALFYDIKRQLILDYVGGVADVEGRKVRMIGDPRIRLREDPIRILRAIRLAARMNCTIEPATWRAIEVHCQDILHAAPPRVSEDLLRMFRGGAVAPAMDLLLSSGVLEVILPELHQHLARAVAERGAEEVEALRTVLRVVDARTHAGRPLPGPAQLALLLAPALLSAGQSDGSPIQPEALGEALKPIALRLAISRKDCERIRQLLATLPKLLPRAGRKRRGAGALVRRAYFPDALDVFEVTALTTGDFIEEAARWRRRLEEAPAHSVAATDARRPPRSSRRRRGGAKRRDTSPDAS
jgi:poly(A) polymerase